jgi:hypothetical protein
VRATIPIAVLFACLVPAGTRAAQEDDATVAEAWRLAYGVAPVDSRAGPLPLSPELESAIAAGRSAVASPSDPRRRAEFADRLTSLGAIHYGNIHEILLLALKESVRSMNEDKKHWLNELAKHNAIADELNEYLRELTGAASRLSGQERGARPAGTVTVTARTFDAVRCEPCVTRRAVTMNAAEIGEELDATRELQRRLAASRRTALAESEAIERREYEVVAMLAEVLRGIDAPPVGAQSSP